jgi:hypothetical protein
MTVATFAWINITAADGELIDRFEITDKDWAESDGRPAHTRAHYVLPLEGISDALARVERREDPNDTV